MTQYHLLKVHELTQQDHALWRKMIARLDPFDNPLLHPDYAQLVNVVRRDVEICVVFDNGEPCGFLPFHRHFGSHGRPLGEEISGLHALVTDRDEIDFVTLIKKCELTRFEFDQYVGKIPPKFVFRHDKRFRINLERGYSDYVDTLKHSNSFYTQIARQRRKLQRDVGTLRMLWHSQEHDYRTCMIEWKSNELKYRGSRNPMASPWVINLIDELLQSESEHCKGLLSVLFAGNQIAAIHFGVVNESTLVSWIACINPKFARYSLSAILFLEMSKAAASQNVRLIDLGRGENQTKIRLANDITSLSVGAVCVSKFNFQRLQLNSHARHVVRSAISRLKTKLNRKKPGHL